MHSPDIVRKNIRIIIDTLGKERKLTRKEFAEKYLHISDTHFSNMLAGRKEIPQEIITYIAHFFNIPIAFVGSIEFDTEVLKKLHDFIDLDKYTFLATKILSPFYTDEAMKDPLFENAINLFKKLIYTEETYPKESWACCKKAFYLLFKTKNFLFCAANTIIVIFHEFCDLGVTDFIRKQNSNATLLDILELEEMISVERVALKKSFLDENSDMFDECIKAIAQDKELKDFALFSVAFRYLINMIDNGISTYTNSDIIGGTMLDELNNLGNKYAKAFYDMFLDMDTQG